MPEANSPHSPLQNTHTHTPTHTHSRTPPVKPPPPTHTPTREGSHDLAARLLQVEAQSLHILASHSPQQAGDAHLRTARQAGRQAGRQGSGDAQSERARGRRPGRPRQGCSAHHRFPSTPPPVRPPTSHRASASRLGKASWAASTYSSTSSHWPSRHDAAAPSAASCAAAWVPEPAARPSTCRGGRHR